MCFYVTPAVGGASPRKKSVNLSSLRADPKGLAMVFEDGGGPSAPPGPGPHILPSRRFTLSQLAVDKLHSKELFTIAVAFTSVVLWSAVD